jgi:kynurenine formamidase
MPHHPIPTEQEILDYFGEEYFEKHSNWGRWGKDDERGTLNYITPEKRTQAASLVKDGTTVSCARTLGFERAADVYSQPIHFMQSTGERWVNAPHVHGQPQGAGDWVGFGIHGLTSTHLDALSHHFHNGKSYNGFPSDRVNNREGCTVSNIETAKDATVSKGILLDLPRHWGIPYLERGEPIYPEDLEACEKSQGVRVESGDILLVRTGATRRRKEEGPGDELALGRGGLHPNTIPFLHEREVAVLCSDAANDVMVPGAPIRLAIHHVGLVAMGLWLLDNGDFDDLAEACAQRNRWEFMFFIGALRLQNSTGSPVNPIAVL